MNSPFASRGEGVSALRGTGILPVHENPLNSQLIPPALPEL